MAREYKLGDKWSEDFDYDGMIEYGKTIGINTSEKTIEKYADSLQDVNYHTLAKPLFDLEVAMSGDKEKIKRHFLVNYRRTLSKKLVEFGDEPLSTDEIYFFAKGGKTQNEYKVEVLIDDEIDLGTNVFANSEDEAMDKAEELIRERNSKYEDSSIDIVDVVKINATGGSVKEHLDKADSHLREVGTKLYENKNIREKAFRKEYEKFDNSIDDLLPNRYTSELGYAKGGMTEKDKLDEAIKHFEDKIKKQGRITNARDEEQLSRLKELRKSFAEGGMAEGYSKFKVLYIPYSGKTQEKMFDFYSEAYKYYDELVDDERGGGTTTIILQGYTDEYNEFEDIFYFDPMEMEEQDDDFAKGGRTFETKNDLYNSGDYNNVNSLSADINKYFNELEKDLGKDYADEMRGEVIKDIKNPKEFYAKGGETATVSIIYNDIPENYRIVGFSHKGEEVILDELVMTDRENAEYSYKELYMKGMDRDEFWKKYQRVDIQKAD